MIGRQRRRCPALRGYINGIVVAHAILACGHKTLRLVGPEDEEIVVSPLILRLVEAAQHMGIEQHLEKRVHITPFRLEFLRHGDADDLAAVDFGEIKGVFRWAKDLGDFR